MTKHFELIVSKRDAEALARMLAQRRRAPLSGRALEDLLSEARVVAHEELPYDRIAMNSAVKYEKLSDGERRSVVLAHPIDADPAEGRVSVLSPVGLALLGRGPGAVVGVDLPSGRPMAIRVLEATRSHEALAAQDDR